MSMLTATLKGQVTFRKDLLQHLGVRPDERLAVEKRPDGRIEVRAVQPTGSIADVVDMFKRDGVLSLSIDDIHEAALQGWAGQ